MKLLIGADFVATEKNAEMFRRADSTGVFGEELVGLLKKADYRIFNLEAPFTEKECPIPKNGPSLMMDPAAAALYKAVPVDLVTLANNHIMDQGRSGLVSTISTLQKNGIRFLGAGNNRSEAEKPFIIEDGACRTGICACAEHEFSIAGESAPGANPYDDFETVKAVRQLCETCSYVIVLYHGGNEQYRFPSPQLQIRLRNLVDAGASLVIAQHTHCIGCMEEYKKGTIVYGQGNFLFDAADNEYWNTSLLIEVDTEERELTYIPLEKNGSGVRLASGDRKESILNGFYSRSGEAADPAKIRERYRQYAQENIYGILYVLSGFRSLFFVKVLNRLTKGKFGRWLARKSCSRTTGLFLQNYLECESLRDLLTEGIRSVNGQSRE